MEIQGLKALRAPFSAPVIFCSAVYCWFCFKTNASKLSNISNIKSYLFANNFRGLKQTF